MSTYELLVEKNKKKLKETKNLIAGMPLLMNDNCRPVVDAR